MRLSLTPSALGLRFGFHLPPAVVGEQLLKSGSHRQGTAAVERDCGGGAAGARRRAETARGAGRVTSIGSSRRRAAQVARRMNLQWSDWYSSPAQDIETQRQVSLTRTADFREGGRAFVNRRRPRFHGRW